MKQIKCENDTIEHKIFEIKFLNQLMILENLLKCMALNAIKKG